VTSLDLIIAGRARVKAGAVAVVGIPWDGGSSYLSGAAKAPRQIREALRSPAGNLFSESGRDLSGQAGLHLLGDLELAADENPLELIQRCSETLLDQGAYPLFLGGDHSISEATVAGFEAAYPSLTVVQFDAHPDLYEIFESDPHSHACPMARILERGRLHRLIQVGIRASTRHQNEQARKYAVDQVPANLCGSLDWSDFRLVGPIYVSFDMDVLDPACAPGVAHPEHGGLTTRDAINLIQWLPTPVVGADIVELNPARDINDLTAGVAAKLVKELTAKMLEATTV
jgi:agmatinase